MSARILVLLMFFLGSAQAASFDCAKAATRIERMICGDTELSQLDDWLRDAYSPWLDREDGAAAQMNASQKAWLAVRNKCADALCVKQRYEERIAALACDKRNDSLGSAYGAGLCSAFERSLIERQLPPLLAQRKKQILESSNNPEYAVRVLEDEEKAWKAYRDAKCTLYGETEGGSDGWKNAFDGLCRLDETKQRIEALKKPAH